MQKESYKKKFKKQYFLFAIFTKCIHFLPYIHLIHFSILLF